MVEDAMVKEQLTDTMADTGAALISKLDEMGLEITAAFWLFDSEVNEWKLHISAPEEREKGPLVVLKKVFEALDTLGPDAVNMMRFSIGLLGSQSELVRRLRTALHTGPGIERIRFKKSVADGTYIEDALIYRAA